VRITVNNITLEATEEGTPHWFTIDDGRNQIRFTDREAPAILGAFTSLVVLVEEIKQEQKDKE